ncbi:MAG: hypothetical protein LBN95_03425 [Prevotellaceae bacterium]|jgi:hypothetical protein|nr:hypothetical protein [Prevotellaceae bacterium]
MAKIKEDEKNIYLEDYIIPKGMEKEDLKARENIVWAMLGKWLSNNPLKRKKNIDLKDFIYLRFDGMQETVNKAARNYKSTMAVYSLDYFLENAVKTGTDEPKSKRQAVFAKILIMNATTNEFLPYFEKIKMLVGITKQKKDAKKIQYSITAIEPE